MKRKKTLFIVLASVLLVGLSSTALIAGALEFCDGDWEFGHDHHERVLEMIDGRIDSLGLNQEQQAKYQDIRARMVASMETGQALRRELHDEVSAELAKDDPDLHALAASLESRFGTAEVMIKQHIGYLLEIYDMLDAGQKAQVLGHLREHVDDEHMDDDHM